MSGYQSANNTLCAGRLANSHTESTNERISICEKYPLHWRFHKFSYRSLECAEINQRTIPSALAVSQILIQKSLMSGYQSANNTLCAGRLTNSHTESTNERISICEIYPLHWPFHKFSYRKLQSADINQRTIPSALAVSQILIQKAPMCGNQSANNTLCTGV